jgi:adenosylcobinamide amidohydrolase
MKPAFSIHCAPPFLIAAFPLPQNVLSWSLTKPGFVAAAKVAWLQVNDADLPLDVDPAAMLTARMEENGCGDAVPMMTSRDVSRYEVKTAGSGSVTASCLATVGLSNAARIGSDPDDHAGAGTINLLAHVDRRLSVAGMLEALTIATEARTAAVMELGLDRGDGIVTGTGTDCIAIAAPLGEPEENFAGLHTHIGAAIGRCVYEAVAAGGGAWMAERRLPDAQGAALVR